MGTTDLRSTWCRPALIVAISVAMTLNVPELAQADPGPGPISLAALIAEVAEVSQQLHEVGAQIQAEQESVNKAIVEVQSARDAAAAAQDQVDAGAAGVKDANAAIAGAQRRFDEFAVAAYMNGPSASLLMASTPEDIISTASANQALALSAEQVMTDLQRARTEQVNKESAARLAKQKADQAVVAAEASQTAAVAALTEAQTTFRDQQSQIDRLAAERKTAQAKLDAARQWSAPAGAPSAVPQSAAPGTGSSGDRWDSATPGSSAAPGDAKVPYGRASEWDLTLPTVPSAFASGDPIQIINAVLQIASTSMQTTQKLGKSFLQKLGILKPTDTGITNGQIPFVYGSTAVEYVIKRAMSQTGVPYSWGGGNADGPSRGIDSGANTIGFDCSGLILYAFAGVGVKLPHYSGSQYTAGTQIPSAQMRRGDAIFYGPGGSQHVALYLGNGQMLEAPYTGSDVHVSPVRTSGMTPYVARYIQ